MPKSKVKWVAKMLKAIHAQEGKKASREKAKAVVEETLIYCDFPFEHWTLSLYRLGHIEISTTVGIYGDLQYATKKQSAAAIEQNIVAPMPHNLSAVSP